jgi:CheY-like chemotaxis protein
MSEPNETILLVEDTEDDVFLMKRVLRVLGIQNPLRVVEDGQQAIDYLDGQGTYGDRASYPYPRYVFLDLKLPIKSGFDVLSWINNRRGLPKPLVFVLTSSNSPVDMSAVTSMGGDSYIIKPPSKETFDRLSQLFGIEWRKSVKA